MKYKWLLFDLDDTILEFSASEHYALERTLRQVGISFNPTNFSIYEKINRKCWDAFEEGTLSQIDLNETRFSQFLAALNLPTVNANQLGNYYLEQLSEKAVFMDGAKALLETYYQKYQLGIVTNGLKEVQRPKLEKHNLTHYFEIIIVSDEIGVSKPNTDFFDYAFAEMKFPPKEEVLIIGDSLNSDIKGRHNYGVDTCWYNPNKKKNKTTIKPTYEINNLNELNRLEII